MAIYSSDPATTSGTTTTDVTPEETDTSGSSSDRADSTSTTTQQGGEHTYDVDDSVDDDPALDYTSVNDPRQTAEDTTGTAGGEVEQDVPTGWGGGIGHGLGPDNASGVASGSDGRREEQLDAVEDTSAETGGSGTSDVGLGGPEDSDVPYAEGPGGTGFPDPADVPTPEFRMPEISIPTIETPDLSPEVDVNVGGGWVIAALLAVFAIVAGRGQRSGGGA